MKKVAIYTITRNRLDYTKKAFDSLKKKAGFPYRHYVWDNESTDGTIEWLKDQDDLIVFTSKVNVGQHLAANNMLLQMRWSGAKYVEGGNPDDYDYIVRFDNDCFVKSVRILSRMIEASELMKDTAILSPRVDGLNNKVERFATKSFGKYNMGFVEILGGIFRLHPAPLFNSFLFDTRHPMGIGDAAQVSKWAMTNKIPQAYVENLSVSHGISTNEQYRQIPDYFSGHVCYQRYPYVPRLEGI